MTRPQSREPPREANNGPLPPGEQPRQRVQCPVGRPVHRFYARGWPGDLAECPRCAEASLRVAVRLTGRSSQQPRTAVIVERILP
jgi:hypothetical protein